MLALLEYVVKKIVAHPEQVVINEMPVDSAGRRVISLQVAPEDRGKVIGKKGRMAHNMRTLLAATAGDGVPIYLDIVDA